MADEPRVTVCIPTYDRTRWLARAIESVLAQTFTAFRLEIHDDATPGPGVRDVVARFDDPRIVLIEHERNAGIVGNFTRSLLAADTDYVIQLGDDDEACPELLAATVAALDRNERAGLAHARFDLIGPEGELLEGDAAWIGTAGHQPVEPGREFIRRSMGERGRVCASTALIRRAAVPEGAFLQEDFPPFDFACWMRLAMAWDVAFVDQTLCRYRVHTQSHSAGVSEYRGAGYAPGIETLRGIQGARRRQIARTADKRERRVLTRLARRGFRRELLEVIRDATLPERSRGATLSGLVAAVRAEPTLLADRAAWRTLAGSLAGRRLIGRARR
jgi:glycosyltransferase involved in cell wall biosynthesis